MGISHRMKTARSRRRWTQVALADASGIGLRTIRRIEQEDFEPRLVTVRTLAGVLGVRVEWLVFGLGDAAGSDEMRDTEGTP